MIVKIEVDIEDMLGNWGGYTLDELLKEEILTAVKRNKYFKEAVKLKSDYLIKKMTEEVNA